MFDTKPLIPERDPAAVRGSQAPGGEDAPVHLDRLGEQICELAGHLAAATCRFLVLLGDFDARKGAITPDTIVPAWYGERLNLDYAIATCFANAANREKAAAA